MNPGSAIRRRTLEQSFAVATTLLVIVVIGMATVVVRQRVASALERALADRGRAIASSIGAVATPSLLAYNYPALQIAAEGAVGDPALIYVVIHDKEGAVAGVAGLKDASLPFPELPSNPAGIETRAFDLGTERGRVPVLEAMVPVRVEGVPEAWGVVRVGLSHESVRAELRRVEVWLLVAGLLLAAFAVGISRLSARRITAPLRGLVQGTVALSEGDTSYRIPVSGVRELAELGQAFNKMMDRLREKASESAAYQDQLAALNATLEQQVRERTRALEESEAQYRTLVEHSPDSILIVQRGRVRFVNRAFEELFDIPEQQAVNERFRLQNIFDSEQSALISEHIEAWEAGEARSTIEILARDHKGALRQMELRGSRIDYRGAPAAECLLVDMTETKELREQLADTERLRSLGELASGVAHDFNNLLGAILGRIQLLRRHGFDDEIDREMTVIEKAAMDGRETVRRIQEFSRLRTDRPLTAVDLEQIIHDAAEITRTSWESDAARRNVTVDVKLECETVTPILGNATELREVFMNLILNSIDAMPQGGTLTLRCFDRDDRVIGEVVDTGAGMSDEVRRRLFDPFFTTKGMSGTGLGMSVAYGIVRRHDGQIEVESEPGCGTRFLLDFPACDPKGAAVSVTCAPATPLPVRAGRILVIDDEPSISQLLEDALHGEGHSVTVADSGRQGVELAVAEPFDLVLTDLGMPDMSGWEVAKQIRATRPELPIVFVTGWGTSLSREEVERSGVAAVIHKPFEIRELLQTTCEVLRAEPLPADEPARPL